jgi:hypothetical protein
MADDFMAKNEEKLKKVFEIYCAYGEPMNTKWLKSSKLLKMLKDCGIVKGGKTYCRKNCMKELSLVDMDLIIAQLSYVATQKSDKFNAGQSVMSTNGLDQS